MNFDDNSLKKYLKKSPINDNEMVGKEFITNETNIEALAKGTFPKKLLDEQKNHEIKVQSEIMQEIEKEHKKLLSERPIPELLESAELILKPENLENPKMGSLYEQKKEKNETKKKPFEETNEGHVA